MPVPVLPAAVVVGVVPGALVTTGLEVAGAEVGGDDAAGVVAPLGAGAPLDETAAQRAGLPGRTVTVAGVD